MRVGVFTALLAQMPLDDVIAKLKGLGVTTVELGTGNYPGDPHCKLSMLDDKAARKDFKQKLDDNGFTISALSCHGNPLHPNPVIAKQNQDVSRRTILLAEKLGVPVVIDFSTSTRLVRQRQGRSPSELGHLSLASRVPGSTGLAVGQEGDAVLDQARQVRRGPRREDRDRDASRLRRLQSRDAALRLRRDRRQVARLRITTRATC